MLLHVHSTVHVGSFITIITIRTRDSDTAAARGGSKNKHSDERFDTTTTTQRGWFIVRSFCLNSNIFAVSETVSRRWWCVESLFPTASLKTTSDGIGPWSRTNRASYIYLCIYNSVYIYIYVHISIYLSVYLHVYIYIYIYVYIYIYTHTYTYTYTYTHTYA